MSRLAIVLAFSAFLVCMLVAPSPVLAENTIVVEMHPPGGGSEPFPVGWAVINVPKGNVQILAILPSNTDVPASDSTDNVARRRVFEAWLADWAPPHPCPVPVDEATPVAEEDTAIELGESLVDDSTLTPVRMCGSRWSSETGFRGFPGLINKTFQYTYFPVSQGLLRKVGPPLGDWQFYTGTHSTNMGLVPYDVVGVTVEPPGTGSPRLDYDPRPHPVVILVGRIPHPSAEPAEGGEDGQNQESPESLSNTQRRPVQSISVR